MFGWNTPLPQKITYTNLAFMGMVVELTDDEKGWNDTVEDFAAIAAFAGTTFSLWTPPAVKVATVAAVAPVLAPVAVPGAIISSGLVAGGVVADVIDPEQGLQNYINFYTEPSELPERIEFTAETVVVEVEKEKQEFFRGVEALGSTALNVVKRKAEEGAKFYLKHLRRIGIRI